MRTLNYMACLGEMYIKLEELRMTVQVEQLSVLLGLFGSCKSLLRSPP
jgi:hypothetical protein